MQGIAYRSTLVVALPLFYFTLAMLLPLPCPVSPYAALLWLTALLLSFLGGIEFGAALRHPGNDMLSRWVCGISLFPILAAFIALAVGGTKGLWVVAGGHLSVYAVDRMLERVDVLPPWFISLRGWMSLMTIGCVAFALIVAAFD